MKRLLFVAILAAFLLPAAPVWAETIMHDGVAREYRVHVPPSYRPGTPIPLLVALHGGGGNMNHMARDSLYGLTGKADSAGFIVAFPNGTGLTRRGGLATWNAGQCCAQARDAKVDDVGFIAAMVAAIKRDYTIAPDQVFATGMSNGAMMAYRLACELPGTFRAIAAVAGTDNTLSCNPVRPVSILHIHALDDTHVLYNGGAGADAFRDISKVTDFKSVPDTVSEWSGRNRCSTPSERILSIPGAWCDTYSDCDQGTRVQLCVTETGGHSWPGGHKPHSKTPPSKALNANDVMWDFFVSVLGERE